MGMKGCGCGCVPRKPVPRKAFTDLWALAANGAMPGWKPTRVAMGRDVTFKGGGTEWLAEFRVQVDQRGLDAMVLIVPSRPRRSRTLSPQRKLAQYRFLLGVGRALERLGYTGDVEADGAAGINAAYHKVLADIAAVEREIVRLDGMKLAGTRRTTPK